MMIENHRTQLIWRLMWDCPGHTGLRRAGFRGGWLETRTMQQQIPSDACRTYERDGWKTCTPPDGEIRSPQTPQLVVVGGARRDWYGARRSGTGRAGRADRARLLGGDCLNVGRVPSKTRCAHAPGAEMRCRALRRTAPGRYPRRLPPDARMRIRARITRRFFRACAQPAWCFAGEARFTDPDTKVDDATLRFKGH
jgi:hypothetical protein